MATKGRRRSHGEGSIYKRESDGRWVGSLHLGYVAGKRVRKTVYGKTEREVLQKLGELRRAAEMGQDLRQPTLTVSAWLEQWLRIKEAEGVRPSTMRFYRQLSSGHLEPALGSTRLDRLTPADVRAFLNKKSESHLSPATVAHLLRLLRNTLGEAERLDLIPRNVAKAVRMPRVEPYVAQALTVADARRLLAAMRGHRLEALFTTALVMGLRKGELLGLSWSDLDFDNNQMHVHRALQRVDGRLRLVPTKSRASSRALAVPAGLMRVLAAHRAAQHEERLRLGTNWPGTDLVFTSTTGSPLEPRNVSREWDKIRRPAGLPTLRLHDLRHSCASILTALGVHPRVVMEMLRHSEVGVTMNVYAHVSTTLQQDAADALDRALFG